MSCIVYDMIGWLEDHGWEVLSALAIFAFLVLPMLLYAVG